MKSYHLVPVLVLIIFISIFIISYFITEVSDSLVVSQDGGIPAINTINEFKEKKKVVLVFTGDVMLGRKVMIDSLKKDDPLYPFRNVSDKLHDSDITFINLETPIIKDCPEFESGFTFCADPRMVDGLTFSGVDVVSLANNHTTNFGQVGFNETIKIIKDSNIEAVGYNNLAIKEVAGTLFGFLGFDLVSNVPQLEYLNLITQSKEKVDYLTVGVHWGEEYEAKGNAFQRDWGIKYLEAGADTVVGHHPHWVQDMECFRKDSNGKVFSVLRTSVTRSEKESQCDLSSHRIYYSLGNLIFDQMWSEETKKGLVVRLTFEEGNLIKEEFLPTYIPVFGQPVFVGSEVKN